MKKIIFEIIVFFRVELWLVITIVMIATTIIVISSFIATTLIQLIVTIATIFRWGSVKKCLFWLLTLLSPNLEVILEVLASIK